MSLSKWNAILEERSRKWKKCLSITSWKANIEMAFRPTTSTSKIKIPDHSYQKLHTTRLTKVHYCQALLNLVVFEIPNRR